MRGEAGRFDPGNENGNRRSQALGIGGKLGGSHGPGRTEESAGNEKNGSSRVRIGKDLQRCNHKNSANHQKIVSNRGLLAKCGFKNHMDFCALIMII